MIASKEIAYRLGLTQGFLAEAEQDLQLARWRSCVDNAQLAVENAGKTVLAVFGVVPKTHDPARQVAGLLRDQQLPADIQDILQRMLPDLLALGSTEHFLTDYGDEANYKLPWELFTEESAVDALSSAQRCYRKLQNMLDVLASEPGGQSGSIAGVDPPSPLAGS